MIRWKIGRTEKVSTFISDGCEQFVIQQPVTHSCIVLKIESKNEFDENLLWNKIRDGLLKKYKKSF